MICLPIIRTNWNSFQKEIDVNGPSKPRQLSIWDDMQPDEVRQVPVPSEGIGGELLNIMSKGLYTNPLDAIREYVQNSIDAGSDNVEIQITGNSVWILDDGDGMNGDRLIQARDFGVSSKSIMENVGFRGIGIYSGFDLCERLVIRTKPKFDNKEYILTFNFGDMRRKLEAARQSPARPVIPLSLLLEEHTRVTYKNSTRENQSFTLVQLEELSNNHIHRLSNILEMKGYILRTLPLRFSEEFKHADDIEKALRKNVDGYKSARVILKIENSPQIIVEKPNIPDLGAPTTGFIKDSTGKKMAFYWACLTSISEAISARGFVDFAGLVYKIKGFTIGNTDNLRNHFTRKQMYLWWTGEIYVIDPEIVPTSARDNFEAGPAKDRLEAAVREVLNGAKNTESLQKLALDAQAARRADKTVKDVETRLAQLEGEVSSDSGELDKLSTYSELDNIIQDLKDHKGKASDKSKANSLLKRAENLQKQVKRLLEKPDSPSTQSQQSKKAALQESGSWNEPAPSSATPATDTPPNSAPPAGAAHVATIERPSDSSQRELSSTSLVQVIQDSGWIIDESAWELMSLIGEAIADNLGIGSRAYAQLLSDIEERLTYLSETN